MAIGSVVVGGAIAIVASVLGAVAGPFALHSMQRKESSKRLRREKIEEAISLLFAHRHWLSGRMQEALFGGSPQTAPSPLLQASAIISIYCPDCRVAFSELGVAAANYEVWLAEAAQRKLDANSANYAAGYKDVYPPYIEKSDALTLQMAKVASNLTE